MLVAQQISVVGQPTLSQEPKIIPKTILLYGKNNASEFYEIYAILAVAAINSACKRAPSSIGLPRVRHDPI
jgi:hypothetical protein